MKRVLSLVLLISLFVFATASNAQFTLTQANVPAFGTIHSFYSTQEGITVNVGPSGANQTWTVSQVDAPHTGTNAVVQPNTTPFAGDFPTATHAYHSMDEEGVGNGYSFTRITADGAYALGMASGPEGAEIVIVFDDGSMDMPFPTAFGTQWTSVGTYTIDPFPGMSMTISDSTTHHVDGYGTINTQFGSFNALRLVSHSFIITETTITGLPPTTVETTSYYYEWITQSGVPAVTMWSEPDETNPNFTIGGITFAIAGGEATEPVRGPVADNFSVGQNYPNPFNPTTSLPITLNQTASLEITIYNELGEVVSSETRNFGPGNHTVDFDGSAWASGSYFAQVKNGSQQFTKRMQLVK